MGALPGYIKNAENGVNFFKKLRIEDLLYYDTPVKNSYANWLYLIQIYIKK